MLTEKQFHALRERALAGSATAEELTALEPYRMKRAVFMAAGFGSRMVPVTLITPKPLVTVNGRRIIDTLLDAVLAAGITEIYLVRGYKAECFDVLREKYPTLHFVENPLHDRTNNISSVLAVKDCLSNAYVFEADLVLSNPALISPWQYRSGFLGARTEKTDDWCLTTDDEGVILSVQKGGRDCHHLFGVSWWTEADGQRLAEDIPSVFNTEPEGQNQFFEAVPLTFRRDHYRVYVGECSFDDIVEIDTFDELCALDPSYRS